MALDLDLLRALVAVADTGSVSAAADRLLRTQAAISLRMRRLEDEVGGPVLRRDGRVMRPTERGEVLLAYARRMLALEDEAVLALAGADAAGTVRLGMVQDFADTLLSRCLGRFARAHPSVRLEVQVDRSARLAAMVADGALDLAVAARLPGRDGAPLRSEPMLWLAAPDAPLAEWMRTAVPLAVIDAPCPFRDAALAALDAAGRPWRIVFQSPSLAGVMAAVRAGLALTVRTRLAADDGAVAAPLPVALSAAEYALYRAPGAPSPARARLEQVLSQEL